MKDTKKFWDKLAARYAKSPIRDEKVYQRKLALTQKFMQPDWTVLEFGCGTGSTAIIHAPFVKHIVATDLSDKMLEIAAHKAKDTGIENISFQQGTLDSLTLEAESFDAVLGLNVLHLIEDLDTTIQKVHCLLKPEGIFVSSTVLTAEIGFFWRLLIPIMQFVGFAPYVNRFGKQELSSALVSAGFDLEVDWQPAASSVFIIARKGTDKRKQNLPGGT